QLADAVDQTRYGLIHQALMDHQVVFFRDQQMTLDEHKAFARQFGALHIHPGYPALAGHPEVMPLHTDAKSTRIAGEDWHSDVSCDAEPPMGTILHLHTVPKTGGDTLFASMYAAYDALSDSMKAFLEGLTAHHDGERTYRGRYKNLDVDDSGVDYPKHDHPVIRTHPVTKRKGIFVNRLFTSRINGLKAWESDALLQMLFRHIEKPEFQVRFQWRPGSVAFWDNRCVQHYAIWDYFPETRSGFRVTVCGDRPF
ncbi:MAG: TauD/TfdA family dioxygenase, partial [Rhodospirillaceae bacterium]